MQTEAVKAQSQPRGPVWHPRGIVRLLGSASRSVGLQLIGPHSPKLRREPVLLIIYWCDINFIKKKYLHTNNQISVDQTSGLHGPAKLTYYHIGDDD